MKVPATLTQVMVEGDNGPVEGVCVECRRCGHTVSAFGRSSRSVGTELVLRCAKEGDDMSVALATSIDAGGLVAPSRGRR